MNGQSSRPSISDGPDGSMVEQGTRVRGCIPTSRILRIIFQVRDDDVLGCDSCG